MSTGAINIKIDPQNVSWDMEEQEIIDFDGVSASDFGGTSFNMSTANDGLLHYFWGDENSTDADPVVSGRVENEVDYGAGASSAAIATAVQLVIDALPGYTATVSGTAVTVIRTAEGDVTDSVDTDSGVLITKCQDGGDFDLGLLDGDIEVSFDEQMLDVTAHQNGTTILAALRQGNSAEITTVLQETQSSKLKEFFGKATGGIFNGATTEMFGQGSSRQGENALVQARRLRLKPVNASDDLENLTFWKAYPIPSSLVFSGENKKLLTVTWKIFNDDQRDSTISLFAFGDQTQAGL